MMENFGRPMLCHNGVPFIVNDFIPVADSTKADIYCLHLSEENGVTGLYGGETPVSLWKTLAPFRTKTQYVLV